MSQQNQYHESEYALKTKKTDAELVADFQQGCALHGKDSNETSEAFEPIFQRYWSFTVYLARQKLGKNFGERYGEDLAAATLMTTLMRLRDGKEKITDLKGLIRHSLYFEHADLMEKLFQGRRLARAGIIPGGSEVFLDQTTAIS
jgi:DNA-directed RNA polymerase specialized sigma24 family protein